MRAEQARAVMLELFPDGFEEVDGLGGIELAAYTDAGGEERLWQAFGGASSVDVPEDWQERWRTFHRPVRVGPVWIGPPWEEPPPGALAVVIDPGRAFGTGSHPTTRLCVELLLTLAPGASLVDLGCGSGVLSIAAARLGFGPVVALDSDPEAVEATVANAARNGVRVDAREADAIHDPLPASDLAVANMTLGLVEQLAPPARCGRLITSGYLVSERPSLPGFEPIERRASDGWAADLLARQTG